MAFSHTKRFKGFELLLAGVSQMATPAAPLHVVHQTGVPWQAMTGSEAALAARLAFGCCAGSGS